MYKISAKNSAYEMKYHDCDNKYIGSTKRLILARFKEHLKQEWKSNFLNEL